MFFDPKFRPVFCHKTANFISGSFLVLGKTVNLAPSDLFFDFSFPSYGRFLEAIEGLEELHESFQPVRDYDNDDGMTGYYVVIKSKKVSGGTP